MPKDGRKLKSCSGAAILQVATPQHDATWANVFREVEAPPELRQACDDAANTNRPLVTDSQTEAVE